MSINDLAERIDRIIAASEIITVTGVIQALRTADDTPELRADIAARLRAAGFERAWIRRP